ncbi:recombinase family protein, partial [Chromohalobacter sp. HP20-39]
DTLVVWRLDRLGRNLQDLVRIVNDLEKRGIKFKSLKESIDTGSPSGKLGFHMFAALAEFEREVIRERTMAGLAAARARGRK